MNTITNNKVHLVYVNTLSNSNKYWKATAHENGNLIITWGRVGYNGQSKTYNHTSFGAALYELHTLATKKKQKGYRESVIDSKTLNKAQVIRALELLQLLRGSRNNHDYNETINEYLSLVPTPLGMNFDPSMILSRRSEIERHEGLLQDLLQETKAELELPSEIAPKSLKSLSNLFWQVN